MEFRDQSWTNIVYVSVITTPRTTEEIKQKWGLENELDSRIVKNDLERLVSNRLLQKKQGKYVANLESQPFRDEFKTYLNKEKYPELTENFKQYLEFITDEEVKEELFSLDEIKEYHENNPEKAIKNPMELFSKIAEILYIKEYSNRENADSGPYDSELSDKVEKLEKKI